MTHLSRNFTESEFCRSDRAFECGIDNWFELDEQVAAAKFLCEKVIQPARDQFGPIIINSGFRGAMLNKEIGGAATSQHCRGEAADIICADEFSTCLDLAKWIEKNCDFDQLILERFDPAEIKSGWVHVSTTARWRRRESLRFPPGATEYLPGLS